MTDDQESLLRATGDAQGAAEVARDLHAITGALVAGAADLPWQWAVASLRAAADDLEGDTRVANTEGFGQEWSEQDREVYVLAIEEAKRAIRARADEIERVNAAP